MTLSRTFTEDTNAAPKFPTGVPGLDVITRGGIPRGRTTLITGKSGAGKSVLALQIAAQVAERGNPAVYFAVEERPEDLCATANSLGFRLTDLMQRKLFRIVDLRRPLDGPTIVTGEYDTAGVVARIAAEASAVGAKIVVIDSVGALFHPRPPEETLRGHFFALVHALERLELTVILTSEAPADYSRPTLLGIEDYLCDLVVVLRNVVDGKRRRRSVEVHKYRRSPHQKGEYACTITGHGMTIFPLDAQAAQQAHPVEAAERFSSGLAGLDDMNAGGWLRDSIVLVRGPSGSGKTTLAGMYACAGAQRGERVCYYGFEETRPILVRNFQSMGLPIQESAASGALRLICHYPEATSPEDLLIALRRDLDEYRPSLIVLDSISSIEHSTSLDGFRTFLIGLAALLRESGRSALLTQTIGSKLEGRQDPPFLSTVADAILMLDYTADAPILERTMRVLKMRGSAHAADKRRIEIGVGGLRVQKPGSTAEA